MTRGAWLAQRTALVVVGALLALLLGWPLVALALGADGGRGGGLAHPLAWPALRLSLATSLVSLAVIAVTGTPLAYVLAGSRGRLARLVEIVALLPIVVPPAVAGVALLLAFGRRSALGAWLGEHQLAFTPAAVIVAQTFVAAPFYVQAALTAFRRVDPDVLLVARSLGASPWRVFARVAAPLAWPGLAAGAALAWARALGEFGATLLFAGNLEGTTQTLPLAVYTALEIDVDLARALSLLLVAVALVVLVIVRGLAARAEDGAAR